MRASETMGVMTTGNKNPGNQMEDRWNGEDGGGQSQLDRAPLLQHVQNGQGRSWLEIRYFYLIRNLPLANDDIIAFNLPM